MKNNSFKICVNKSGVTYNQINGKESESNQIDYILKKIDNAKKINTLANILIIIVILIPFYYKFIFFFIIGIILKIVLKRYKKIELNYEFDDLSKKQFEHLNKALNILSKNQEIWEVNNYVDTLKQNKNITRRTVFVITKLPRFIKSNVTIYGLNLNNTKMLFAPDGIIVLKSLDKSTYYSYDNVCFETGIANLVETGKANSDAKKTDETYEIGIVKYPVYQYGRLKIECQNEISTLLYFSNSSLLKSIQENLISFDTKNVQKEKNLITTIDELKKLNENDEESKPIVENKKSYTVPEVSILLDEESKSIIPFIDEMKKENGTFIPIGTYENNVLIENIARMPNMLIGGTVMSGKTTYLNSIISSILLTKKPNEAKMIIYDSKGIDYVNYNGIPHLLSPVIISPTTLNFTLHKVSNEINSRLKLLSEKRLKNINQLNNSLEIDKRYPDIIVLIDDLTTINDNVEIFNSLEYIVYNGWNVNVYAIVIANYPSHKVIPSISKQNFPARLSFRTASSSASRMIIDDVGAEKLTEPGTALYISRYTERPIKIKVPYITDNDLENIIDYCKKEQNINYQKENEMTQKYYDEHTEDETYNDVVEFAIQTGKISATLIQRRFRFGYNRAARMMDLLEERGVVGPQNGSKPRNVLINRQKQCETSYKM